MRTILVAAFALLLTPTPALAQDSLISDADYCEVVADDASSCQALLAAFSAREQGLPVSGPEFRALVAGDVAVCEERIRFLAEAGVVPRWLAGHENPALPPVEMPDMAPPPDDLRVGRSLGSPEAPVRIDVYEDPQCPACGLFTSRIEPLLIAGPIADGEVFFTYKDMTFLGPESFEAAAAMRVAEELDGKFWEYHDVLFHNQGAENEGAFSTSRLADMAELIGLDRDEFLAELVDPRYVEAVQAEFDEARELGINSTPTLVVNGGLHPGVPDWDELRELIAAERS